MKHIGTLWIEILSFVKRWVRDYLLQYNKYGLGLQLVIM